MSARNDGGPAFPSIGEGFGNPLYSAPGMSLRDYFAAQALPFCLAEFGSNAEDQRQFAEAAYQIADAMLAERSKAAPPEGAS